MKTNLSLLLASLLFFSITYSSDFHIQKLLYKRNCFEESIEYYHTLAEIDRETAIDMAYEYMLECEGS